MKELLFWRMCALLFFVAACTALPKPETMLGAARAKTAALPLAFAVQDCVTGTAAEVEFAPHFNALLDKSDALRDLPLDKNILQVFADARGEVESAANHWRQGRAVLAQYGVQCSEFVKLEAANFEQTFEELQDVLAANERLVFYGEYALTLGRLFGVLPGQPRPEVERMEVPT